MFICCIHIRVKSIVFGVSIHVFYNHQYRDLVSCTCTFFKGIPLPWFMYLFFSFFLRFSFIPSIFFQHKLNFIRVSCIENENNLILQYMFSVINPSNIYQQIWYVILTPCLIVSDILKKIANDISYIIEWVTYFFLLYIVLIWILVTQFNKS